MAFYIRINEVSIHHVNLLVLFFVFVCFLFYFVDLFVACVFVYCSFSDSAHHSLCISSHTLDIFEMGGLIHIIYTCFVGCCHLCLYFICFCNCIALKILGIPAGHSKLLSIILRPLLALLKEVPDYLSHHYSKLLLAYSLFQPSCYYHLDHE